MRLPPVDLNQVKRNMYLLLLINHAGIFGGFTVQYPYFFLVHSHCETDGCSIAACRRFSRAQSPRLQNQSVKNSVTDY